MKSRVLQALLVGAIAATLAQPAAANNDTNAAIAAGVIGLAVGASLGKHSSHSHKNKGHFSPEAGIECYDKQRACYHSDGGFAYNWTNRIY